MAESSVRGREGVEVNAAKRLAMTEENGRHKTDLWRHL
jgi:hypothetical protein